MANYIQLASMIPDRDCTLEEDMRKINVLRFGVIDCNGLSGIVVSEDEYDSVLTELAKMGWTRFDGERGGPEGLSVSWLDNPTVKRTEPWMSEDGKRYLSKRKN